jgi:mannosyl-3-phosphoglycerate phosphatase family protein
VKRFVIFTDLDGTLLDYDSYSFDAALPALSLLAERGIPLVLCSSKTKAEIEHYRIRLDNHDPFISENGGGIFIPKGYFHFALPDNKSSVYENGDGIVIRLGAHYSRLREAIAMLRKEGLRVKGFGDMTAGEIAAITGLGVEEAEMAKKRDFDEPLIIGGGAEEKRQLVERIKAMGFHWTKDRFFHILGNSDKGKAVSILAEYYRKSYGTLTTIAAGDSLNDLPMLRIADIPIVVRKADGSYDPDIELPNLIRADGIGPEGWNKAIRKILST